MERKRLAGLTQAGITANFPRSGKLGMFFGQEGLEVAEKHIDEITEWANARTEEN